MQKFLAVAKEMAKIFRGYFFAAHCTHTHTQTHTYTAAKRPIHAFDYVAATVISESCSYQVCQLGQVARSSRLLQVGRNLLQSPEVQEILWHLEVLGCQVRLEVRSNLRRHITRHFIICEQGCHEYSSTREYSTPKITRVNFYYSSTR